MNRDRKLIFLTVLYFAILGCFLLGCSEGTDSSPVSALMGNINSSTSNNKIAGCVLNSSTNEPLSNIYVQLLMDGNFLKGELTALDGSFTFNGIDNGTYSVNISKDGFETINQINNVYVTNGSTFNNYILYLKAVSTTNTSQEAYATIKGIVKRSDNSSAANTPIVLCSDPAGTQKVNNYETLVLGDGSFTLFNVPAGTTGKNYFIRVGESSSEEKTIYPIGIDNKGNVSPTNITINVNVSTQASTISKITFKVVSAYTGASLELATVKINNENVGTTNINGEVIINNLSTGMSLIEIEKEGFETLTSSRNFQLTDNNSTKTLTMVEDTKDGYGSITGRYVNIDSMSGVGNLYVRLYRMLERTQTKQTTISTENIKETWYDVDQSFILTTRTANGSGSNGLEGSFKLTHIEPGYYQLYIGSTTDIPNTELRSQVYPDFLWTQLKKDTNGSIIITQPFKVEKDQTTYWTNYEQGNN